MNLTEGRRLHDRDPNNPAHCATCTTGNGMPLEWPCLTAIALGATGRSEWTNGPTIEPADSIDPSTCGNQTMHYTLKPCAQPKGHTDDHGDSWGNTTSPDPRLYNGPDASWGAVVNRCTHRSKTDPDLRCVFDIGHQGGHITGSDGPRCAATLGTTRDCRMSADHDNSPHRTRYGYDWPNDMDTE